MDGILLCLALLTVWKLKLYISGFGEGLSRENTYALRGVMAVLIVLHHLSQNRDGGLILLALKNVGVPCVALFLFFSGYGLHRSALTKKNYAPTILKRRIPSVLVPYLILVVLYWLANGLMGTSYPLSQVLLSLVNGKPVVTYSWYILCILVFYANYWLSLRLFSARLRAMALYHGASVLVWVFLCKALGYGEYWYNATISFPLGILWAQYEQRLSHWLQKRYFAALTLSAILFAAGYVLALMGLKRDVYVSAFWTACLGCIAFVVLLMMKCGLGNPVLRFLGQISFELYGIHGLVMLLLQPWEHTLFGPALILLTAAGRKSVRQRGRLPFTPRERMCYTVKKRKKEDGR